MTTSAMNWSATPGTDEARRQALAGKYLTFNLGKEDYGLPVLRVREIIKIMDITAVPQAPPHVRGVINLRGRVIPVVDLRSTFGLPPQEYTDRTCIIVVEIAVAGNRVPIGVVVDTVSEVLNVSAEELEEPPPLHQSVEGNAVMALAKVKGRVKILLDADRSLVSVGVLGPGGTDAT